MMVMYHKIWIEVDVEKDMELKTEKIKRIMEALEKIPCIVNISKVQYKVPIQEEENRS